MATLLIKQSAEALVGAQLAPLSTQAVVTVRGDGVLLYKLGSQKLATRSYPLGSSALSFQTPAIACEAAGTVHVVVGDGSAQYLVTWSSSQKDFRTLSDVSPRIPLPGKVHSIHALTTRPTQGSSCIAAILQDGHVAWCTADASAAALTVCAAPPPTEVPLSSKLKAAAALGNALVVAYQGTPGSAAVIVTYTWSHGVLGYSRALRLACPTASATLLQLWLTSEYAAALWSSGTISVLHGLFGSSPATQQTDISTQPFFSSSSAASSSQPSSSATPQSARKRKSAATTNEPGLGLMLVAPVDETQLMLATLEPGGSGPASSSGRELELSYCVVDSRYGCTLAAGHIPLDSSSPSMQAAAALAFAAGRAASGTQLVSSPDHPGHMLLLVEGHVMSMQIALPKASLISLLGRMTLQQQQADASASQRSSSGVVLHLAGLPSGHQWALQPAPASITSRQPRAEQDEALLRQLEQALSQAPAARQQLLAQAVKHVQGANQQRRQQQQHHGVLPRLLTLLCQLLSDGESWQLLEQVLQLAPQQGLAGCSGLLPAAAAAQQYSLLSLLCIKVEEVEAHDAMAALRSLLRPTSATTLAARKAYYTHVRGHAAAAITEAEQQLAAAAAPSGPSQQQQHEALALAACAAAVVDGFSYAEALLHPLLAVPMDTPGLQVLMQQLDNSSVDRLLAYLAKWVDKYTHVLGDAAHTVVLPPQLLFPTFPQVLDWVKVTLDCHLARLLMSQGCSPAITKLQGALKLQVDACQQLLPLHGVTEHIRSHAPLPAAHVAAATQYTVELLDLSISAS